MTAESVRDAINKLKELSSKTSRTIFMSDWKLQGTILWLLYTALQGCIDLAAKLISAMGKKTPDSYSDAFRILGEANVFTPEEAERFSNMAKFRNVLAHSYTSVNLELVFEQLQHGIADIESCLRKLVKESSKHNLLLP
ncbi:MAG: DUF86 domain-containing protein [Promethearchaeati archaeon SRVP18_Atabeyarchaeia-1]